MEVLYQKDRKVGKIEKKTCLLFYGCYGNGEDIISIMISHDLQ